MMPNLAAPTSLPATLRGYWWLFLIRGLLGIALGIVALMYPLAALAAAVLVIGVYLVVDGIVAIVKAVQISKHDGHWWILLLEGLLGVAVGISIFAWPGLSIVSLALLVGYWAIFSGILTVAAAIRGKAFVGGWLYAIFGVISIVFGALVLLRPGLGLTYIVLMIAFYGFFTGITMLALAFRTRRLAEPKTV